MVITVCYANMIHHYYVEMYFSNLAWFCECRVFHILHMITAVISGRHNVYGA